jgi:hypothetical protein
MDIPCLPLLKRGGSKNCGAGEDKYDQILQSSLAREGEAEKERCCSRHNPDHSRCRKKPRKSESDRKSDGPSNCVEYQFSTRLVGV